MKILLFSIILIVYLVVGFIVCGIFDDQLGGPDLAIAFIWPVFLIGIILFAVPSLCYQFGCWLYQFGCQLAEKFETWRNKTNDKK